MTTTTANLDELLEADAAARTFAATAISKSISVEAGAGTGKTTLLIARIVNLLLFAKVEQPQRAVEVSEIVAITFTEKAAGELKTRLRDTLRTCTETSCFNEKPLDAAQVLLLRKAFIDLDTAHLTTIHSFCSSMIRERPVEAGIEPGQKVADPVSQTMLVEDAWSRWREHAFQDEDDDALAEALRLGVIPEAMKGKNSIYAIAMELNENRECIEFLPEQIDIAQVWKDTTDKLLAYAANLDRLIKIPKKEDKPTRLAKSLAATLKTIASLDPESARTELLDLKLEKQVGGNSRSWADPDDLEQLRETLNELYQEVIPDTQALLTHNLAASLITRVSEFVEFYQTLKNDRGLLDFNDLLLIARNMLRENPSVLSYFRDQFHFFLVDEFQDTDPLQAEIVLMLTCDDPTTASTISLTESYNTNIVSGRLFVVGDPKQSIYRFRRADIEMYDSCVSTIGVSNQAIINQNFRSSLPVINFVNKVFSTLITKSKGGKYQPAYVPLIGGPESASSPGCVALVVPPKPKDDCTGSISDIRFKEGCAIANLIDQAIGEQWPVTLQKRPLKYGDVAILVRQYTDIDVYEDALRAFRIPYHIAGGRHFYNRMEIQALTSVLSAIDHPEDYISIVASLRSPFFGISDEALCEHVLGGRNFNYLTSKPDAARTIAPVFDLLTELHSKRNNRPISKTISDLFDRTKGLESFLIKPQGEQRVANLLKVMESARTLESTERLTFRAFARWIRKRQSAREEEAESLAAEPGEQSVQILTIHKSKGLEFPMTVLAGLSMAENSHDELMIMDRMQHKISFKCGRIRTMDWRSAKNWNERRDEAERRRLFYVATTRAKDYLVVATGWTKQSKPKGFETYLSNLIPATPQKDFGTNQNGILIVDTRDYPPWPEPTHAPRIDPDDLVDTGIAESFTRNRKHWQDLFSADISRASRGLTLTTPSSLKNETTASIAHVIVDESIASGPLVGELTHKVLELSLRSQATDTLNIDTWIDMARDEIHCSDSDAQATRDLILRSWSCETLDAIRNATQVHLEVPFCSRHNETICEGRIDVLAELNGSLWIVDFKTDLVAHGDEKQLAKSYTGQVHAYVNAVRDATGQQPRATLLFLRTGVAVDVP